MYHANDNHIRKIKFNMASKREPKVRQRVRKRTVSDDEKKIRLIKYAQENPRLTFERGIVNKLNKYKEYYQLKNHSEVARRLLDFWYEHHNVKQCVKSGAAGAKTDSSLNKGEGTEISQFKKRKIFQKGPNMSRDTLKDTANSRVVPISEKPQNETDSTNISTTYIAPVSPVSHAISPVSHAVSPVSHAISPVSYGCNVTSIIPIPQSNLVLHVNQDPIVTSLISNPHVDQVVPSTPRHQVLESNNNADLLGDKVFIPQGFGMQPQPLSVHLLSPIPVLLTNNPAQICEPHLPLTVPLLTTACSVPLLNTVFHDNNTGSSDAKSVDVSDIDEPSNSVYGKQIPGRLKCLSEIPHTRSSSQFATPLIVDTPKLKVEAQSDTEATVSHTYCGIELTDTPVNTSVKVKLEPEHSHKHTPQVKLEPVDNHEHFPEVKLEPADAHEYSYSKAKSETAANLENYYPEVKLELS